MIIYWPLTLCVPQFVGAPPLDLEALGLAHTVGLLQWRTAVRIRTFGWCRPDFISRQFLKVAVYIEKILSQNVALLAMLLKHNSSPTI